MDWILKAIATVVLGIALILFYVGLIPEDLLVFIMGIVVEILSANLAYSGFKAWFEARAHEHS